MSDVKKYMNKLRKLDGAVNPNSKALENCLQSPSPSINWAFAIDGYGIPYGTSIILWGPQKCGKSLLANAFLGQCHKDDPEAITVTFNTELRGEFQGSEDMTKKFGIDQDRHITFDVNSPELVFDRIEQDIDAMCQEGAKIKAIVIDSLSEIVGRRTQNATSILTQQIGDRAATLSDGIDRIKPIIRKHKIALILVAQARAEMDMKEQMRGKTIKMNGALSTKHKVEIFAYVERNQSKAGKESLGGESFADDAGTKDFMDKAAGTAHKIRFRIDETSFGMAGRTAEITFDYNKGIINKYEEVFTLAKNLGIITKPNNVMYEFNGRQWRGLMACLTAIRDEQILQDQLLKAIFDKDKQSRTDAVISPEKMVDAI
jgi:archaellum biogenesis ATPase FlaH